jgi:hypothetical protein
MRRRVLPLAAAVIAGSLACASNPSGPTPNTTTTLQLSITPNPITAVAGPFVIPQTGAHPFALSHLVIHYQGITSAPLTVNTEQWKLMLTDGTVGIQREAALTGFRIPAGQQGTVTYDVNDQPGGSLLMLYSTGATQANGTLTISWTYTADNGATGTASASVNVTAN